MEFRIHQRLLLITIFSILVFNFEHCKFVHNVAAHISAPNLQPSISPSPEAESPNQDLSPTPTTLPSSNHVSFPPSEAYSPSDSLPPSESISPSSSDPLSEAFASFNFDESLTLLSSANIDPEIEKICSSTDYPPLCLATIVPHLNGRTDLSSVVEIAIKASNAYAKFALSAAKKVANTPGTPDEIVSILNDCSDSYEDVLDNFQKAMAALPARDIGTINTMLSAVITDAGDCEDALNEVKLPLPTFNFGERLINMTSNCLAIVSLTH